MSSLLDFLVNRINSSPLGRRNQEAYIAAFSLAAIAIVLTNLVPGLRTGAPYLLSLMAVMLASWFGGLRPGMAVALVCVVAIDFFVQPPRGEFTFVIGPAGRFLCLATLVSVLNEARMRSQTQQAALLLRERSAEARYKGLFEGVADAILVAGPDRTFVDANTAAERLLGYNRVELLSMTIDDVVPPGAPWAANDISESHADGRWLSELQIERRDGTQIPVEASATTIDLPEGRVNISAIRDVSERIAAQREQQAFIESVSHDLNNPLASVTLHVQLLQRRLRSGILDVEKTLASLDTVQRATHRIAVQLDELQDAARLRSGQQLDLRLQEINLEALIRDSVFDAQATTSRHQLTFVPAGVAIVGRWDPLRLRRTIDNLLNNAIKYSPDNGTIIVTSGIIDGDGDDRAVIVIEDQGSGIPVADLPYVFDRYRRGSNVGERTRGAGIGLSGVRQIVEGHGGRITVTSEEGVGSAFRVEMPFVPHQPQRQNGNLPAPPFEPFPK